MYDEIKDIDSLKEFALNKEVLDNIFSDYFREIYIKKVEQIIEDTNLNLQDKMKNIMIEQLNFTLIPIEKQRHYREKYSENYFDQSYILKVKSIIN